MSDTLYIPFAARICISRRFPVFFCDPSSLELESLLSDNSIGCRIKELAHVASVCRYYSLDAMVR